LEALTKIGENHKSLRRLKMAEKSEKPEPKKETPRAAATGAMESEGVYRSIFKSSRDGKGIADMKGNFVDVNRAFCDMHGYTKEELVNKKTFMELTPKKWVKHEADIIKNQVMKRGYSDTFEKEQIRKNGEVFPVHVTIHLIRGKEGKPILLWAIVRDITEQKNAQDVILAKKEELEKFNKLTIGRELKMIELKKRIKELEASLGGGRTRKKRAEGIARRGEGNQA